MKFFSASFLRAEWGLAFALLAAIGFWFCARVIPVLPVVFGEPSDPVLLGNDPWFHLHQTEGAVRHFPRLIRWDVGTFYPEGSYTAAAGLFNLSVAGLARAFTEGEPSREFLIRLLAWTPVFFGAVSLLVFFALAREFVGIRLALLAVFVRVFFPGSEMDRTLLGFADQHAAEILLTTLGLWLLLVFAKRVETESLKRPIILYSIASALPFALFLFTWYGAPLHIAILLFT